MPTTRFVRRLLSGVLFTFLLMASDALWADPCGMVPPVYTGPGVPIKRVGPQKTYVFYKNGMESIVLRPSFSGKVSNFGMLIPFPTPPAIRKVPDHIFSHIAAAIDPPEVRVWIRRYRRRYKGRGGMRRPSAAPKKSLKISAGAVRVLRKEAVGMYQVAVLEAGSPKALKKWMKSHGYVYPKGMDKVVLEYIRAKWCFVVVKTKVGGKQGVSPRPGMRRAHARFPRGGTFKGAVQAMGFRFRTRKLVVPMRLSAFNKGRLRNVVYLLTDKPKRIRHISSKFVRRQLSGQELYRNVTSLLPLRVMGGRPNQIRRYRWRWIQRRRNPLPHNGLAKVLFASDLMAVRKRKLALPHEEKKKVLLRIGERLMLRGQRIDALNRAHLSHARKELVETALKDLKKMTMTIVDGDFPREILSRENLSFSSYRMSRAKNKPAKYNARMLGVSRNYYAKRGKLTRWKGPAYAQKWIVKPRTIKKPPTRHNKVQNKRKKIARLLRQLRDPKRVDQAVTKLAKMGSSVVPYLWAEVIEEQPIIPRGWAIVALSEMGRARMGGRLAQIHKNARYPRLLRTWAAAGRIAIVRTIGELKGIARLVSHFPATKRPFRKKLTQLLKKKKLPVADLLVMASRYYFLRRMLTASILKSGHKALIHQMTHGTNNRLRRQAAAYVGSLGLRKPKVVAKAIIHAYRFNPKAKRVPWHGGALFVPSIRWKKGTARELVGNLIAWHLWCEGANKKSLQKQIHNNIRSLSLARVAGYRSPGWRPASIDRWLTIWGKTVGCGKLSQMLKRQGVFGIRRYQSVLGELNCPF